jgi:hypothetical protein
MRAIIWKDFRTIVYHPQKLLIINAALLGLVIWLGISKGDILKTSDSTFLLFLMPLVMLMNVYQLSFQLIYSEKSNKSWEKILYLFDTGQVFLAKSIVITLVSWVISMIFGGSFLIFNLLNGGNFPPLFVFLFSLFLLPVFAFVLSELMILITSLIGQLIVVRIIFIPLFITALTFVSEAGKYSLDIQLFKLAVYVAIGIGISFLLFLLTKKISKERLVTSS